MGVAYSPRVTSSNSFNPKETFRKFPPSGRYLVGVSGGRDSVALLHWLLACGYRRLVICHLNHRLRGRAATADARFVRQLAAAAHVPFELRETDVATLAAKKKQSIETSGRESRYEFFAAVARKRRCRTIFLGHHADDLVETTLWNLFRGAGPGGLANMREVSRRMIGGVELTIVRPLLGVWRKEIETYVKAHGLKFREDATNSSVAPYRNRIRHRVLPQMEKELGRDVRANIWRTANLIAEEERWLDEQAALGGADEEQLSVRALRLQPIAMQRRIIHRWLRGHRVADVSYEVVERVRALIAPNAPVAKTNLPRDLHVRRRAGRIFIEDLPPPRRAKA